MTEVRVRQMSREELDIAVSWAAREGWNPGIHDADCFYAADPTGYFVATIKDEPVGFISAVAYDDTFGFIGFYIVEPRCRGHRVGIELGRAGLSYLGERNVGLDGVENKVSNYQTYGFKMAYHNVRYEGRVNHRPQTVEQLCPIDAVPFEKISTYDRGCFPAERTAFLKNWLTMPDSTAMAYVKDGRLKGFGMIRACGNGYKVAPLFADDKPIAMALLQELLNHAVEGESFFLDVPEVNEAAGELVRGYPMKAVFGTARMYSRGMPDLDLKRVFGVTSFELG